MCQGKLLCSCTLAHKVYKPFMSEGARELKWTDPFCDSITKKEENEMNASVAIQTLPEAANDEELIRIVDEVIAYIKSTGLNYYVGPFETAIEGDYDELMDIVKECQHIAVRAGAPSVAAYIKVSYKPEGDVLTIEKKVTKHHQ